MSATTRYALVTMRLSDDSGQAAREIVARYLPGNYRVVGVYTTDFDGENVNVIIAGEDVAGWTLQDYVIPRLASGLYYCRELKEMT